MAGGQPGVLGRNAQVPVGRGAGHRPAGGNGVEPAPTRLQDTTVQTVTGTRLSAKSVICDPVNSERQLLGHLGSRFLVSYLY